MSEKRFEFGAEDLTSHAGALRRLARSLLHDPHAADDVVQETFRAALSRPPRHGASPRAWLFSVLRNLAAKRHRSAAREAARILAVARERSSDPASAVAARLETERRLVEAVTGLPGIYRTVIVLRYFEGLGPSAIARRLDCPVKTVDTRLRRGLAELRSRLERRSSDERFSLLLGLDLLARRPPSGGGLAALGGTIMAKKLLVAAAALLLLTTTGLLLSRSSTGSRPHAPVGKTTSSTLTGRTGPAPSREARARQPATSPLLSPSDQPMLFGIVLDGSTGAPISGAKVRAFNYPTATTLVAHSGSDGRFSLPATRNATAAFHLAVSAPGFAASTFEPVLAARKGRAIRLGHGGRLVGTLTDPGGHPVSNAELLVVPSLSGDPATVGANRLLWHQSLPESLAAGPRIRTDGKGRFDTGPLAPGRYALLVRAPGKPPFLFGGAGMRLPQRLRVKVRAGQTKHLVIRLPRTGKIRVRIRDGETGEPLTDARFAFASGANRYRLRTPVAPIRSGPNGLFTLPVFLDAGGHWGGDIEVLRPGYGSPVCGAMGVEDGAELTLDLHSSARVRGVLRSISGQPVRRAIVLVDRCLDDALLGRAVTGPLGRFEIRSLPARQALALEAYSPSLKRHLLSLSLDLRPGEERILDLGGPGSTRIFGRVTHLGRPVKGAWVEIADKDGIEGKVETGTDGTYRFEGVSLGETEVLASLGELVIGAVFARKTVTLAPGDQLRLDFRAALPLRGVLVDADSGRPVNGDLAGAGGRADVQILARRVDDPAPGVVSQTRPRADGSFELLVPAPGVYQISLEGDYRLPDEPRVDMAGSSQGDALRIVAHRDPRVGRIEIRVLDAQSGGTIRRADLEYERGTSVTNREGEGRAIFTGSATLEHLRFGELHFEVKAAGHVPQRFTLTIDPVDHDLSRTVRLVRSNSIRILSVEPASSAAEAGLTPGDVLVEYDGQDVKSMEELKKDASATQPLNGVVLTLLRYGKKVRISVRGGRLGITAEGYRIGR